MSEIKQTKSEIVGVTERVVSPGESDDHVQARLAQMVSLLPCQQCHF